MDRIPDVMWGKKYRLISDRHTLHEHFDRIVYDLKAFARHVPTIPQDYLEIWEPHHPLGDVAPNMILDLGDPDITISDLGDHEGHLTARLNDLIGEWQQRYADPTIRLEQLHQAG